MQHWLYLAFAILSELIGTVSLKYSNGFARLLPSLCIIAFYALSFYLLSLAVRRIELGVAYAIWSGVGTVLIAIVGILIFDESATILKAASIVAIVAGVVGLNLATSVS